MGHITLDAKQNLLFGGECSVGSIAMVAPTYLSQGINQRLTPLSNKRLHRWMVLMDDRRHHHDFLLYRISCEAWPDHIKLYIPKAMLRPRYSQTFSRSHSRWRLRNWIHRRYNKFSYDASSSHLCLLRPTLFETIMLSLVLESCRCRCDIITLTDGTDSQWHMQDYRKTGSISISWERDQDRNSKATSHQV